MRNDGRTWEDLCAAAAQEPDSHKLVSLVDQILEIFEKRDEQGALSRNSDSAMPGTES